MKQDAFDCTMCIITAVVLFSFGHPVGGCAALVLAVLSAKGSN